LLKPLTMRAFILLLLYLIPVWVTAQIKISGTVKDQKGRPVPAASISIKDSYDGATADSSGKFSFNTSESGKLLLIVSAINYKTSETPIDVTGSSLTLLLQVKEEVNEMTAVVITAGSFEASDTKRTTVLNPIDIVTTASANADVTGALRTLPGAQQVGENEGLFVRGGTAEESKFFIDGTLVNNFFLSGVPDLAQRGRFSPFLFKGTVFSSGGYSALYGQALSAAVILESVDMPDRTSSNLGISTVGASAGYQHLAKDGKSSWGASYNYTDLSLYFALVKQRPDNFKIPVFHNGDFNFRIKTSKTGILKFYGYFNLSDIGVRRPDIDSANLKNAFSLHNGNVYANLSWKEKTGKNSKISIGAAFSSNTDEISSVLQDSENKPSNISDEPYASKSFMLDALGNMFTLKAVWERRFGALSAVRGGAEYILLKHRNVFSNRFLNNARTIADDNYFAAFAETDLYITNELAAKIGVRTENSSLLNKSNVAPRISLAYKTSPKGQVSLAYGLFYQRPDKDFFLRAYDQLPMQYMKATHYIANYQVVSRDYTFRTELYYKKYGNLVKLGSSNGSNIPDIADNNGDGYAKGFELFFRDRKTLKNFDYWISYSFLDTKRNYLNYPMSLEPNFAARHTANLVMKRFVTSMKTQFNLSYTYATGRPYYNILYENNSNKVVIADQGRTIPYQNLSFSVNYLPFIGKQTAKSFTVFVFSVNNVLGSNQVFGYNYSANGARKEAILPPARSFFFLGAFFSFGVDRSDEIINSNL
jgi:vitamin B12 transporter